MGSLSFDFSCEFSELIIESLVRLFLRAWELMNNFFKILKSFLNIDIEPIGINCSDPIIFIDLIPDKFMLWKDHLHPFLEGLGKFFFKLDNFAKFIQIFLENFANLFKSSSWVLNNEKT